MKRLIAPYEMLPKGYGISYRHPNAILLVCYPVPMNWVVRWAREVWRRLRMPGEFRLD